MKANCFYAEDEEGLIKHIVVTGNCYIAYRENPFYFEYSENPNLLENNVKVVLSGSTKVAKKAKAIWDVDIPQREINELRKFHKYSERQVSNGEMSREEKGLLKYLDRLTS